MLFRVNSKGEFAVFECTGVKGSVETGELTFYSYGKDVLSFGKSEKSEEGAKKMVEIVRKFEAGEDIEIIVD